MHALTQEIREMLRDLHTELTQKLTSTITSLKNDCFAVRADSVTPQTRIVGRNSGSPKITKKYRGRIEVAFAASVTLSPRFGAGPHLLSCCLNFEKSAKETGFAPLTPDGRVVAWDDAVLDVPEAFRQADMHPVLKFTLYLKIQRGPGRALLGVCEVSFLTLLAYSGAELCQTIRAPESLEPVACGDLYIVPELEEL
jgi:hypothetical protein